MRATMYMHDYTIIEVPPQSDLYRKLVPKEISGTMQVFGFYWGSLAVYSE